MDNAEDDEDISISASICGASKTFTIDLGDLKTPRKEKRRSWFTPGLAPDVEHVAVESDVLVLDHFLRPPRIDFGSSVPGKCKIRRLVARNPRPYDQVVTVEKAPEKLGFAAAEQTVVVPANGEVKLTLTWLPDCAGDFRGKFQYLVDGRYKVEAVVFGKACDLPKPAPAKGKRRPWVRNGHMVARPLAAVQNVPDRSCDITRSSPSEAASHSLLLPEPRLPTVTVGIREARGGAVSGKHSGTMVSAMAHTGEEHCYESSPRCNGSTYCDSSDSENLQPTPAACNAFDVARVDVIYRSPKAGVESLSATVVSGSKSKTSGAGGSSARHKKKQHRRSNTYSKTVVTAWLADAALHPGDSTPLGVAKSIACRTPSSSSLFGMPSSVTSIDRSFEGNEDVSIEVAISAGRQCLTTPVNQTGSAATATGHLARVTCSIDTPMKMAGCVTASPPFGSDVGSGYTSFGSSTCLGASCSGLSLSAVVSPDSFLRDAYSPSAISPSDSVRAAVAAAPAATAFGGGSTLLPTPASPGEHSRDLPVRLPQLAVVGSTGDMSARSPLRPSGSARGRDDDNASGTRRSAAVAAAAASSGSSSLRCETAMSSRQVALRALARGRQRRAGGCGSSPKTRQQQHMADAAGLGQQLQHPQLLDTPTRHVLMQSGSLGVRFDVVTDGAAAAPSPMTDNIVVPIVATPHYLGCDNLVVTPPHGVGTTAAGDDEEWLSPPSASRLRNFPLVAETPAAATDTDSPRRVTYDVRSSSAAAASAGSVPAAEEPVVSTAAYVERLATETPPYTLATGEERRRSTPSPFDATDVTATTRAVHSIVLAYGSSLSPEAQPSCDSAMLPCKAVEHRATSGAPVASKIRDAGALHAKPLLLADDGSYSSSGAVPDSGLLLPPPTTAVKFATVTKAKRPATAKFVARPTAPRRLILDGSRSQDGAGTGNDLSTVAVRTGGNSVPTQRLSPSKRCSSDDAVSSAPRKLLKTEGDSAAAKKEIAMRVALPGCGGTQKCTSAAKVKRRSGSTAKPRGSTADPARQFRSSRNPKTLPGKLVLIKPTAAHLKPSEIASNDSLVSRPTVDDDSTENGGGGAAAARSAPLGSPADGASAAKPSIFVRHLLPFAGKNTFYDETWMEKREHAFSRWLNYVLTPTLHSTGSGNCDGGTGASSESQATLLAAAGSLEEPEQASAASSGRAATTARVAPPQLAHSRESLSLRSYEARRQLDVLRRCACQLYQSTDVAFVLSRVEAEVESQRLVVRRDRHLRSDLGLKQKLVNMLLSYNPLWLRVGLETIFGEVVWLAGNVDTAGLTRFISTRLLGDPGLSKQYAHPTVPHLYRAGYDEAMSKHALKKFLLLVYFLDRAKLARLIDYDPCLFRKDAAYKSSRELLVVFSSEYLSGEGDITKHLGYHGYKVYYVQSPLDEFDYAVRNLSTDLRDGIRLTRVVEMLTRDWTLTKKLRLPATSRLQRIHNVSVSLKAMAAHDLDVSGVAEARDIVDGHREKTLCLLWRLIAHFQFNTLIDLHQLQDEVAHLRPVVGKQLLCKAIPTGVGGCSNSNSASSSTGSSGSNGSVSASSSTAICGSKPPDADADERTSLLLQWCRLIGERHGVSPVENFSSSFADGRLLCVLVHHYQPSLIADFEIRAQTLTTLAASSDSAAGSLCSADTLAELLQNERHNLKLVNTKVAELGAVPVLLRVTDVSNTLPDEKAILLFVAFLCSRLLTVRREARAARVVQAAWRAYVTRRLLPLRTAAARKIQIAYRRHRFNLLLPRRVADLRAARLRELAAAVLQRAVRAFLCRRRQQQMAECERQATAAGTLQRWWRRRRQTRLATTVRESQLQRCRNEAATLIQASWRAYLHRCAYLRQRQAAAVVQRAWRMHNNRRWTTRRRAGAASQIQSWWRARRAQSSFRIQRAAAQKIQKWWRACRARRLAAHAFRQSVAAAEQIQRWWRTLICRRLYMEQRHAAAAAIQSWWRAASLTARNRRRCSAAIAIQSLWRMHACRQLYGRRRGAALLIQSLWRMHACRSQYVQVRLAAVKVQTWWRMQTCRELYRRQQSAAVRIQSWWQTQTRRILFEKRRLAAVVVQSWWRATLCRQRFQLCRVAAVRIQSWWRTIACRAAYQRQQSAARTVQAFWRMHQCASRYSRTRRAAVVVQSWWRMLACRDRFKRVQRASLAVQSWWRMCQLRAAYERQRLAAIRVQSWWRMVACRDRFQRVRRASLTVQSWWRMCRLRAAYEKQRLAAVRVQAWWRMLSCRLRFAQYRSAAIVLQSWWRMVHCRSKLSRRLGAATAIQRWWRACAARVASLRDAAAVTIQAQWRAQRCRLEFQRKRSAAIIVQSHWRSWGCQRAYRQQIRAAVAIQTWWRMTAARRQRQLEEGAAVLLQSWWRALRCRIAYRRQQWAAIVLQYFWRERCARVKRRHEETAAAVLLQCWWRGARCRWRYAQMRRAAVVLQRCWRSTLCDRRRRSLELLAKAQRRRSQAATAVQARWRAFVMRTAFVRQRLAATAIQSWWRMCLCRAAYERKLVAAWTIQAWWRSVLRCRANDLASAAADAAARESAAIEMQSWWRMQRCRRAFESQRWGAVRLQQWWRAVLGRRLEQRQRWAVACIERWYIGVLHARREEAAVTIQLWYRSAVECRSVRLDFLIRRGAAITIQSWVRGFVVRRRLQYVRAAAVLIQAHVRGFLERRRSAVACGAAVTIQAAVRAHLARRRFLMQLGAAITLQRAVRDWIRARRRHLAASVHQSTAKSEAPAAAAAMASQAQARAWAAARVIQRRWRSLLQHRLGVQQRRVAAARTIQRAWLHRLRRKQADAAAPAAAPSVLWDTYYVHPADALGQADAGRSSALTVLAEAVVAAASSSADAPLLGAHATRAHFRAGDASTFLSDAELLSDATYLYGTAAGTAASPSHRATSSSVAVSLCREKVEDFADRCISTPGNMAGEKLTADAAAHSGCRQPLTMQLSDAITIAQHGLSPCRELPGASTWLPSVLSSAPATPTMVWNDAELTLSAAARDPSGLRQWQPHQEQCSEQESLPFDLGVQDDIWLKRTAAAATAAVSGAPDADSDLDDDEHRQDPFSRPRAPHTRPLLRGADGAAASCHSRLAATGVHAVAAVPQADAAERCQPDYAAPGYGDRHTELVASISKAFVGNVRQHYVGSELELSGKRLSPDGSSFAATAESKTVGNSAAKAVLPDFGTCREQEHMTYQKLDRHWKGGVDDDGDEEEEEEAEEAEEVGDKEDEDEDEEDDDEQEEKDDDEEDDDNEENASKDEEELVEQQPDEVEEADVEKDENERGALTTDDGDVRPSADSAVQLGASRPLGSERVFVGRSPGNWASRASERSSQRRQLPSPTRMHERHLLPENLGNDAASSISHLSSLLRYRDVGRLLEFLQTIVSVAETSASYRSDAVRRGLAVDLLDLAGRCNRSVPHVEVVSACARLLLILAQDGAVLPELCSEIGGEALIDLLAVYGPLCPDAFLRLCRLLVLMSAAAGKSWIQRINLDPVATQKLSRLHSMTSHKVELQSRKQVKPMSSSVGIVPLHQQPPSRPHASSRRPPGGRAEVKATSCATSVASGKCKTSAAASGAATNQNVDCNPGFTPCRGATARMPRDRPTSCVPAGTAVDRTQQCLEAITLVMDALGLL